jgi:hypothetical protein
MIKKHLVDEFSLFRAKNKTLMPKIIAPRKVFNPEKSAIKVLNPFQQDKLYKSLIFKGTSRKNAIKTVNIATKLSKKYFNSPWVKGVGGGKFGKYRKLDFDGDGKVNMYDCYPFDKSRQDVIEIKTVDAPEQNTYGAYFQEGNRGENIKHLEESANKPKNFIEKVVDTVKSVVGQSDKQKLERERNTPIEKPAVVINTGLGRSDKEIKKTMAHEMLHHFYRDRDDSSGSGEGISQQEFETYGKEAVKRAGDKRNNDNKVNDMVREELAIKEHGYAKKDKPNERLVRVSTYGMSKKLYDEKAKNYVKGYKPMGKHIYTRDEYQDKDKASTQDYSAVEVLDK